MNFVSSTVCFESIESYAEDQEDFSDDIDTVQRMRALPDEYCTGEYYAEVSLWAWLGISIYAVLIPLLVLVYLVSKRVAIYRIGSQRTL